MARQKVKSVSITDTLIIFDDDTCWPNPNTALPDDLADPTKKIDRAVLISFINAYRSLIWLPSKRREPIIRKIRNVLSTFQDDRGFDDDYYNTHQYYYTKDYPEED